MFFNTSSVSPSIGACITTSVLPLSNVSQLFLVMVWRNREVDCHTTYFWSHCRKTEVEAEWPKIKRKALYCLRSFSTSIQWYNMTFLLSISFCIIYIFYRPLNTSVDRLFFCSLPQQTIFSVAAYIFLINQTTVSTYTLDKFENLSWLAVVGTKRILV